VSNGFLVLCALIGIWLTIKLPRRVFLIGSFAVTCVSLIALSLLPESSTIGLIVAIAWAPETKHLTLNEASGV
jgi:MFS transporter, putative metabolite transport protein